MFPNVDLIENTLLKNDSLGQLEHSVHSIFSETRTAGEDYVYASSTELINLLDNYCVDQQSGNRPPLLVLGEPGVGKSSLLSNWIAQRKKKKTYSRHTLEEYIFWHAVGCSELSCKENNLIFRLIQGLKETFGISREIPIHAQEKLRWELPRFLELASKKGKIIIVIDGVHRISPDEKNDSVLSWLPQQSTSNIKIILTATIPIGSAIFQLKHAVGSDVNSGRLDTPMQSTKGSVKSNALDTASDRASSILNESRQMSAAALAQTYLYRKATSRILRQLERRQLQILRLKTLEKQQIGIVLKSFIQKTVEIDLVSVNTHVDSVTIDVSDTKTVNDVKLEERLPHNNSKSKIPLVTTAQVPGFLLFSSHIRKLLLHRWGTSPNFVRLCLSVSYMLCCKGYSLWHVWDYLLQARDTEDLLNHAIDLMEQGYIVTESSNDNGNDSTSNSATNSARLVNPETSTTAHEANANISRTSAQLKQPNRRMSVKDVNRIRKEGGVESLLDLYPWHPTIRRLIADSTGNLGHDNDFEAMADLLDKDSEMDSIGSKVSSQSKDKRKNFNSEGADGDKKYITRKWLNGISSFDIKLKESRKKMGHGIKDSLHDSQNNIFLIEEEAIMNTNELEEQLKRSGSRKATITSPSRRRSSLVLESSAKELIESTNEIKIKTISDIKAFVLEPSKLSFLTDSYLIDESEDFEAKTSDESLNAKPDANKSQEAFPSLKDKLDGNNLNNSDSQNNSLYAILPDYLTGGQNVLGLGPVLGSALSLLYTARHGLKERELWQLLAEMNLEAYDGSSSNDEDFSEAPKSAQSKSRNSSSNPVQTSKRLPKCPNKKGFTTENKNGYDSKAVSGGAKTAINSSATASSPPPPEPIGPLVEVAVLKALRALGVLHLQQHQFLVLPPNDDGLRSVVYDRYIEPTGGLHVWNRRLVHFFEKSPATMRRCEELPWHMKHNRKWYNLKNLLVSLDTFALMFFSNLRNEYMEYWEILTKGPMFATDEAERDFHETQAIESEANNAVVSYINRLEESVLFSTNNTDSDMKKVGMKNQVTPFDLIQEFNTSVEKWKHGFSPKDSELQIVINLIGKFLCEFTLRCYDSSPKASNNNKKKEDGNVDATPTTTSMASTYLDSNFAVAPQYLRQSIELKYFATLGINVEERSVADLDIIKTKNKKFLKLKSVAELTFLDDKTENPEVDKMFPNKNQIVGNLYLYLRWIWMQFPWIAFDNSKEVGSKRLQLMESQLQSMTRGNLAVTNYSLDSSQQYRKNLFNKSLTESSSAGSIDATRSFIESGGMLLTSGGATNKMPPSSADGGTRGAGVRSNKDHFIDTYTAVSNVIGQTAKASGDILAVASNRSFESKKYDPNAGEGTPTTREELRTRAVMASAMKSTSNTLRYLDHATNQISHEENRGIDIKNAKHPGIELLDEMDPENPKNKYALIPFSAHSVRTVRKKSLFPSMDKLRTDEMLKTEGEDLEHYTKANAITRLGGKGSFDPTLWQELQAAEEEERRHQYDAMHGTTIPMSREEILNEKEFQRITKLKSLKNRAAHFHKIRTNTLNQLKDKFESREKDDENTMLTSIGGMVKLQELQLKFIQLNNEILKQTQIKTGYEILIETLNINIPGDKYYLDEIQGYVNLAKKQLVELLKCRRKTYEDSERMKIQKTKSFTEKLTYYSDARSQLRNKRLIFLNKYDLLEVESMRVAKANTKKKKLGDGYDSDSDEENDFSNNASMSAFKDAITKSFARAKRNVDVSNVSFKVSRERADGGTLDGLQQDLLSIKDMQLLNDQTDSKFFDNDKLIQEAALIQAASGNYPTAYKDRDKEGLLNKIADKTTKEYRDLAMKLTLEAILEKTSSKTEEDLIERYLSSKSLSENMLASQLAADERVTRLKEEHEELRTSMGSFGMSLLQTGEQVEDGEIILSSDAKSANAKNADDDHDNILNRLDLSAKRLSQNKTDATNQPKDGMTARSNVDHVDSGSVSSEANASFFIDEQALLQHERKMHQLEFTVEKNELLINESKIGIKHILNTIHVNSKLLHTLPKSFPPIIEKDSDINGCLLWIEEKLVAITEAMALDDSNTGMSQGHEHRVKTFPERQRDLALSVQTMLGLGHPGFDPVTKEPIKPRRSTIYARPTDAAEESFISSGHNVLVQPPDDIDDIFNDDMRRMTHQKDKLAQAEELRRESEMALQKPKNVHKFLDDALASNETKNMLQKAKKMSRQLRGSHKITGGGSGGYGYALENILLSKKLDPNPIRKPYRKDLKIEKDGTLIKPTLVGISEKRLLSLSAGSISLGELSTDSSISAMDVVKVEKKKLRPAIKAGKKSSSATTLSKSRTLDVQQDDDSSGGENEDHSAV